MANKIETLKNKLKSRIGKIHHGFKNKTKGLREKAAKNYDSGVGKVQNTTLADKMADMSEGLTKRDEKELLQNKDSTFRKIRKVFVNGTVIITPFIIGIPIKMCDDAIQNNVDLDHAEEYNKIYQRELDWTDKEIARKRKNGEDVEKLVKYRENIKKSQAKMNSHIEKLKADKEKQDKATEATKEALAIRSEFNSLTPLQQFMYMQPEHFDSMDEFDNACTESFKDLLYHAATSQKYPKFETVSEEPVKPIETHEEPVNTDMRKTAFIATEGYLVGSIISDINLGKSIRSCCSSGGKYLFNNGKLNTVTIASFDYSKKYGKHVTEYMVKPLNSKLKVLVENMNSKLAKTGCRVSVEGTSIAPIIVLKEESITKHAENGVRKAVNTARDVVPDESPVKKAERATEPLDNAVNNVINSVKDALRSDTQRKIIDGKYRFKLVRIIGKCIAYGGLAVLVHPAVAAIAFLGKMAFDKHIDTKERSAIVHDLESEKKICEEKIKDAESKGDNESKYKLMRVNQSLDREIARIKLHQDK